MRACPAQRGPAVSQLSVEASWLLRGRRRVQDDGFCTGMLGRRPTSDCVCGALNQADPLPGASPWILKSAISGCMRGLLLSGN